MPVLIQQLRTVSLVTFCQPILAKLIRMFEQNFFIANRQKDSAELQFDNWLSTIYLPVKENLHEPIEEALKLIASRLPGALRRLQNAYRQQINGRARSSINNAPSEEDKFTQQMMTALPFSLTK
ncbi:6608_t:CDS:2 [Paraglomus brasilianum]|uniref:6608_t:CDS:1 n=1 Tax=Paraglomus brasilianum TaxID=144538 RepID=A0A9N9FTY9_9GLOM|nr:6608_t:CDS:2 [Paraglomus brasilianum]